MRFYCRMRLEAQGVHIDLSSLDTNNCVTFFRYVSCSDTQNVQGVRDSATPTPATANLVLPDSMLLIIQIGARIVL